MSEGAGACAQCGAAPRPATPAWQRLLVIATTAAVTYVAAGALLDLAGL